MGLDWALIGLSTAFNALGAIGESRAMSAQYESSAAAAEHNAKVQNMNAQRENQEGAARELAQRRAAAQQTGSLAASLSESGLYGGTSAGVLNQSLMNAELDALNTRYNASSRANAYRQDAINSFYEQRNYEMYAKGARNSMWGGLLNSVLGGATMAYGGGLFGKSGSTLDTALSAGRLAAGLDPNKPGYSLMGNRTASRGGYRKENLLGGMY